MVRILGKAGDGTAAPSGVLGSCSCPLSVPLSPCLVVPFPWPLRPSFSGLGVPMGHVPVWSFLRPEVCNPFVGEPLRCQLSLCKLPYKMDPGVAFLLPFVMVAKLVLVSPSASVNLLSLGLPGALTLPRQGCLVINLWLVSSHSPKYAQCPFIKMPEDLMKPACSQGLAGVCCVQCTDSGF